MNDGLVPIKRGPILADYVKESIKQYISQNNLEPGAMIPSEKELSQRLGVGRNSVREAVKALESLGVLETRQGSGIYVRSFTLDPVLENLQYEFLNSREEVSDFLQVRQVLELGMIEDALQRITDDDLDALEAVLDRMRARAERGEPCPEEDREFHHRLLDPAGNGILRRLLDIFWRVYARATEPIGDGDLVRVYNDHVPIYLAARARDVAAARAAIQGHYASAQEHLRLRDSTIAAEGGGKDRPTEPSP